MNNEKVLHITNFKDYTHNQLVEMLSMLQTEVKLLRHNKEYDIEVMRHTILALESRNKNLDQEVEKLKQTTQKYLQLLEKPLTFKERLKGKKII